MYTGRVEDGLAHQGVGHAVGLREGSGIGGLLPEDVQRSEHPSVTFGDETRDKRVSSGLKEGENSSRPPGIACQFICLSFLFLRLFLRLVAE